MKTGFTTIELIVVLLLIGLLSAIIIMRLPPQAAYDLDAQKESLLRDLRLTQVLAMSYNQPYQIVFGPMSYQIQNQNGTPYAHPVSGTITTLPSDVTLSSTQGTVRFDNRGIPCNTSNNALTSPVTLTLTAGEETKTLVIEPDTGFAS